VILSIILMGIGLASAATHIGIEIRANCQARKRGKPLPYKPGDIAKEALDVGTNAVGKFSK